MAMCGSASKQVHPLEQPSLPYLCCCPEPMSRFLSQAELEAMGFASLGADVKIDRQAVFINPDTVNLGDHCRIDAFSLISAGPEGIHIGRYVHLGASCQIFGGGGAVVLEDFSCLSGRSSAYTSSMSGRLLVNSFIPNPTLPEAFRSMSQGPVILRKHSCLGCGSVVLPGVELGFGSVAGALTLVRKSVPEGVVICGNPPQVLLHRNRAELERLEEEFFASEWGEPEV
jgi:dTDP-4-amino-4,6-dideoxy-D-glucose acyltransferase